MNDTFKVTHLGEIVDVVGGGTPSKRNPKFYGGTIPWATVRDMQGPTLVSTEFAITEEAVNASSTKIVPAGEVVIASRVGLGKACILAQDTAINQDLRGLIPKKGKSIDRRYLLYWYQNISSQVVAAGTGATVQGVKLPFLKSLPIPLPPLEEQQRIVAILDEAFEGLDRARKNAEANLESARELLQNVLETAFLDKNGDYSEQTLDSLIKITHGFAFKGKDFEISDDQSKPIVLTPGNYTEDAQLNFTLKNTKRLMIEPQEDLKFSVGELTVVMTDLSSKMKILGKPAFIEQENILHNQRIGRVAFRSDVLLPRLLFHFLRTEKALSSIRETATGTMVRHTAPKRILSIKIAFPRSLTEQRIVIDRIDRIESETRKISETIRNSMSDIEELRQSLLQKAFAGELT